MTKKNPDGLISCDGPSRVPKRLTIYGNHINPQMRMKTLHEIARNTRMDMQNLHGLSLVAVTLTDSVLLLEALAIKYGDTPIVEVVNMLLDEAFENYEEKNGKQ